MTEHVYKMVELVGTSGSSVSDAIQNAIARASATIRNVRWFEVMQVRGDVADGKVARYQVTLKIGFTLEEGSATIP
ncbi:dodecin [Falsiroseomonas sp. HW251]|uniref:dodecin n=1 Tax=Falsiroseomonas sp. HW251 TaxID=3390998 RepID=UPI003D310604